MSYEHYCENCDQEVVLEVDGYELLDGSCPECGVPLDYEAISIDIISGWSC